VKRDVEIVQDRSHFVATLRRLADAVEAGESFRIQVDGHRFTVPADATLAIAHEVSDGVHELELDFGWSDAD